MSRVYTERSIRIAANTAALYAESFLRALPETRNRSAFAPNPGTTLVELFLNLFGESDPYLPAEVQILRNWNVSDYEFPRGEDPKLHTFTKAFKDRWPPPARWVREKLKTDFFEPLPQNSLRVYRRGNFRHRVGAG